MEETEETLHYNMTFPLECPKCGRPGAIIRSDFKEVEAVIYDAEYESVRQCPSCGTITKVRVCVAAVERAWIH